MDNDQYLAYGKSFIRLVREYKKHGKLTIGVDFDGTLYDFHKTGASHEQVRQLVRDMHKLNFDIVIWTAAKDLEHVAHFCKDNNIPYDGINTNGVQLPWESRKPFFNALLDDRAGLVQVYEDLRLLVDMILQNQIK